MPSVACPLTLRTSSQRGFGTNSIHVVVSNAKELFAFVYPRNNVLMISVQAYAQSVSFRLLPCMKHRL